MTTPSSPPASSFRLDGRRAVVTGAGRGIGRACALALAEAGAQVIAVARTRAELEDLATQAGPGIETWCADVTPAVAGSGTLPPSPAHCSPVR